MGCAPMLIGERHDDNPASANFRVRAFDAPEDVTVQRLEQRRTVLQGFQRHAVSGIMLRFLEAGSPGASHRGCALDRTPGSNPQATASFVVRLDRLRSIP